MGSNHISLMIIKRDIPETFKGIVSGEVITVKELLDDIEKRFVNNDKSFSTSQEITISKTVLHIGQHPVKAKTTRKGKRKRKRERKKRRKRKGKGRRKRKGRRRRKRKGRRRRKRERSRRGKEKRTGIMEKARLKNIPSEHTAPSEYVPRSSSINGQN